ncbi:MAG: mechanosensitive ion channel [Gammaproteobacteria bacterium]|nr:mechanosensitive ion channel [Gammaproteobacteria bacterium]MBU2546088.1 mechanosensitive ion channel [Gammaproteobacteria bacterium]
MKFFKGFLFLSLLCVSAVGFSAVTNGSKFDAQAANQKLEQLKTDLDSKELNSKVLQEGINQLTGLQAQAKQCADHATTNIAELNKLWEDVKPEKANVPLTSVQKYLQDKRDELTSRQSECALLSLQTKEVMAGYSSKIQELTAAGLLEVKPTFFSTLLSIKKLATQIQSSFDLQLFLKSSGWKQFAGSWSLIVFVSFFIVFLFFGLRLKKIAYQYVDTKKISSVTDQLKITFIDSIARYDILLLGSVLLSLVTSVEGLLLKQFTDLMAASYLCFCYSISLVLIRFFFLPLNTLPPLCGLSKDISTALFTRLKLLAHFILISAVIYVLFNDQHFPLLIIDVARTVFITIFAIGLISVLWLVNRVPKILGQHIVLRLFISSLLTAFLLTILIAEWLGYQVLVNYLLVSVTVTLIYLFIAWVLYKIVFGSLHLFVHGHSEVIESFRRFIGFKQHVAPPEVLTLYAIGFLLIWGGFILILFKVWGMSKLHFAALTNALLNGFKVAGMGLIPSRILSGFLFFIFMSLVIRWLCNFIETRTNLSVEKASQQALSSIIGYVGIAIVLLVALLIAGVNFEGLTIIAGALSVGVGFGLQGIVNNFVSGLILLIEKPIKPGDRVSIGGTEGFVKKIRIRSTQIRTLQRSDLIVPNSEILTGQVTNYMFKDFIGTAQVSVGVAYGSDVELVKKVLLEVAFQHAEVITDDNTNQPCVLFSGFGDSVLNFNLYCAIRNVNLRYTVMSELNFAVDKAFKENKIEIAFPQQDVHIRDWVHVEKREKGIETR